MPDKDLTINLFISTHCPFCSQLMALLTRALKESSLTRLDIINLDNVSDPQQYSAIRSVPLIKIDDFEFTGMLSQSELDEWITRYKQGTFPHYFFANKLEDGQINQAERVIKNNPEYWPVLIQLVEDNETKMQVKIGITALFESLASNIVNSPVAEELVTKLIRASDTDNHAVRVDIVYYLSLIYAALKDQGKTNKELERFMQQHLKDESDEIKEIIEDVYS